MTSRVDLDSIKENLVSLKGHPVSRVKLSSPLAKSATDLVINHLKDLSAKGDLRKIDADDPDRIALICDWNDFVGLGKMSERLSMSLTVSICKSLREFGREEHVEKVSETNIDALSEHILSEIHSGFSYLTSDPQRIHSLHVCIDNHTEAEVFISYAGWAPSFLSVDEETDAVSQINLTKPLHKFFHVEFPAEDPVWIMSKRYFSDKRFNKAFYDAHFDDCPTWNDVNSAIGRVMHAEETLEKTGVMSVYQGDYFPKLVKDKESGLMHLVEFGLSAAPDDIDSIKDEMPEDWKNGYFIVEQPNLEIDDTIGFENLIIGSESKVVAFLAGRTGLTESDVLVALHEQVKVGKNAMRLEPSRDALHAYFPIGTAIGQAKDVARQAGHYQLDGGLTLCGLLSPKKLDFPAGVVAEFEDFLPKTPEDFPNPI